MWYQAVVSSYKVFFLVNVESFFYLLCNIYQIRFSNHQAIHMSCSNGAMW